MVFGFVKDQSCVNVGEFENEEAVSELHDAFIPSQCDEIVLCVDGFGIGDFYMDGEWSKPNLITEPPSIEDRVAAIEEALLTML